ncbi:MAG: zinc ABC transporter solute-binding protein [Methanomicrobiales archaeon]|nr:zinc ABC transporter solute-binding protein [Methanomicrobiales archaeon]
MHLSAAGTGWTILLAAIICVLAAGCTDTAGPGTGEDGIIVAVSILPQESFVNAVAGSRAHVVVLIPPGANPATYEPTADQIAGLSRAGLYCTVGSGLPFEEVYLPRLAAANPSMLIVNTSSGITLIDGDPHVWTSPANAAAMAASTAEALARIDPANAALYTDNARRYGERLEDLDGEIRAVLAGLPSRTFIVYHPSWGYFARDYDLEQVAIEDSGKDPSPAHLAAVIDRARAENSTVIIANPQFSRRACEVIAAQINATVIERDPLSPEYERELLLLARTIAGEVTA